MSKLTGEVYNLSVERFDCFRRGPSLVAVTIAFAYHRRIRVPQQSRQCNEKRSVPWYSDKTATLLTPCRPDLILW